MTEGVHFLGADYLADFRKMAAFGNDDDAVVLAVIVVVFKQSADVIDVDLLLRDKDDMRATGDSGGVGNPAGVAAHHFADDDAIVRVGCGVEAVDGLGRDHDGGVKPKGLIGAADVVVDGLGNANSVDAVFGEIERDRLRIVAAEGDQSIDLVGLQDFLHLFDAAGDLLHIGARGVKDSAALEL